MASDMRTGVRPTSAATGDRRFPAGALTFGFGLGGLADGIVLHHVLGWHNLTSARIPTDTLAGLETNVFWDGVFHLSTTVVLLVGFVLLWRSRTARDGRAGSNTALLGLLLVGWGAFHAVDQLVFHELLGLHDIRQDAAHPALYNWGFFAIGVVLAAVGATLYRRATRTGPGSA
jgi:uncharacterized membrane protein